MPAQPNNDTKLLLEKIARNTEKSATLLSKQVGEGRRNTEQMGEEGREKDRYGRSASNFFQNLSKAFKSKSRELKLTETAKAFSKLRNEAQDMAYAGKSVTEINQKLNSEFVQMSKAGVNINTHFNALTGTTADLMVAMDRQEDELISNQKRLGALREKYTRDLFRSVSKATDTIFQNLSAVASATAVQEVQAFTKMQRGGFELAEGEGVAEDIKGAGRVIQDAMRMGATQQEAIEFAREYRQVLTSISQTPLITAGEATEIAAEYGELIRERFGMVGADQLEAVGKSLSTLANIGVPATVQNFENFNQGIENMARTSNASAEELYSTFEELSKSPEYRSYILALGRQGNVAQHLTEQYTSLAETVGITKDEFADYQRFLAQQTQRKGPERVVQAAFTAQLAETVGGFTGEQIDLIQRGTAFREALGADERTQYDELMMELQRGRETRRAELVGGGVENLAELTGLDILSERAATFDQTAAIMRDLSGVMKANKEQVSARIKWAEKETNATFDLTSSINELYQGFIKSPFAASGLLSGILQNSVFQGVVAANIAGKITGGITKSFRSVFGAGGRMFGMGGTGTAARGVGAGAATGAGATRAAGAAGTKAPIGKVRMIGRSLGVIGMAGAGIHGFAEGIQEEGNAFEKTMDGIISAAEGATLGLFNIKEVGQSLHDSLHDTLENMFGFDTGDIVSAVVDIFGETREQVQERESGLRILARERRRLVEEIQQTATLAKEEMAKENPNEELLAELKAQREVAEQALFEQREQRRQFKETGALPVLTADAG